MPITKRDLSEMHEERRKAAKLMKDPAVSAENQAKWKEVHDRLLRDIKQLESSEGPAPIVEIPRLGIRAPDNTGFKAVADGGARVEFPGGGLREPATGKGRYDLIPALALVRLAQHYENGAKKYADRNWEKGLPLSRFLDSAMRHMVQFMGGNRDEDHLAAALWNISGYIWTEEQIKLGKLPAALSDVPWPPSVPE